MPVRNSPTARQLRIGVELRRLRERAGMTSTEAGRLLGTNQTQISNIEASRIGVSADRLRTLARNYSCSDESLINGLISMIGDRKRGWWEEHRDSLPANLIDLAEIEHYATGVRVSQVINIPGLLQTPEYARAIFREAVPPLLPHEIEYRISHRIKRQAILFRDNPPPYTATIHEAALRMQFGGPAASKAQLDHVISMSERDNVTVLVIPFDGTSFPSAGHGIDYLQGPVPQLDTALIDTAHNGTLIDATAQLERCHLVLDRMEGAALKPDPSRDLIRRIAQGI
ncbi:helix-turn-helix transcriptional regulator [Streptomyces sp. NPDC037389]|uniref:helix-turn-helix domain-containing protein n=1 Tax=Streptomyces sp. NPDC037389 TaxID=3155369 RepID=UPI0034071723